MLNMEELGSNPDNPKFNMDDLLIDPEARIFRVIDIEEGRYQLSMVMKEVIEYSDFPFQWVAAPAPVDAAVDGFVYKTKEEVDRDYEIFNDPLN